MPTTDHDPIDFTFADDGDLVRRSPKPVPEDPIEKRLAREREDNEHRLVWQTEQQAAETKAIVDRFVEHRARRNARTTNTSAFEKTDAVARGEAMHRAIEIRHGSGKVKV